MSVYAEIGFLMAFRRARDPRPWLHLEQVAIEQADGAPDYEVLLGRRIPDALPPMCAQASDVFDGWVCV